jgi:outer membrane protein OmpA-like peptidoglycan-associated protein
MLMLRKFSALTAVFAFLACAGGGGPETRTDPGAMSRGATGAVVVGQEQGAESTSMGAPAGTLAAGPMGNYLDRQRAELTQIPGAQVEKKDDALLVSLEASALFDGDASTLSAGGADRIRTLARTVQSYPKERIIVKGHTDSEGAERSNQRLSEERADSVRNVLVAEGVLPSRIAAVGLGASMPLASNSTAEGRQQNRRVEIELRPDEEVLQGDPSQ